jgi:hypothetical protein
MSDDGEGVEGAQMSREERGGRRRIGKLFLGRRTG